MGLYRIPESVKERKLQEVRKRLEDATPGSRISKSSSMSDINALEILALTSFLILILLGIAALFTGKNFIQFLTLYSHSLGNSLLLSGLTFWMSIIGLGTVINSLFSKKNSKQD